MSQCPNVPSICVRPLIEVKVTVERRGDVWASHSLSFASFLGSNQMNQPWTGPGVHYIVSECGMNRCPIQGPGFAGIQYG